MSSPMPTIVGLTGRAGVGKDTLADHLVASHGYVKYSLAGPLKRALNLLFGFTPEQWEDREWKERVIPWIGKSPRQLAQTLGTEWGRTCVAEDIWLRIARAEIVRLLDGGAAGVVITDIRFDNEARFVRGMGGVVCSISRGGIEAVSAHSSETGVHLALVDAWLSNDTAPAALFATADLALPRAARVRAAVTPTDHHFA